ncbi:MAG: NAD-dependent epimerase/dehydratase family protein [bacterium]|nr:NAD-dependent epimerase/dehydratase family protein [bacterium]
MKIGITGGEGFIGGHLRQFFANQGHQVSFSDKNKIDLVKPNEAALKRFVSGKDIIIHAAGVNRGSDREVVAGNVMATFNLLAAMEKLHSPAKLIFLSSIHAALDIYPVYGKSKRLAEIMIGEYSLQNKKSALILRLPNVFGENSRPFYNSVVATFCYQAANNKPIVVDPAARNSKKPLVYIGNLSRIINQEIAKMPKSGFNLKTLKPEKEISVGALANLVTGFIKDRKPQNAFEKNLHKTFLSFKK